MTRPFRYCDVDLARFRDVQRLAYDCAVRVAGWLEPGVTERQAAARLRRELVGAGAEDFFHVPFARGGRLHGRHRLLGQHRREPRVAALRSADWTMTCRMCGGGRREGGMAPDEARTVTSGGVPLAVFGSGDPANATVLLVHGYPDTHRVWDAVCRDLAEDFHVVRYDVRGSGRSGRPADLSGYRLDRLADDLFAVADAVSPGRPVHVAGHDWGSIQAWHAVTDARAAGRIASFTTISGPCLDHAGYWFRRRLARPTPRHLAQLIGQWRRSWYIAVFQLPLAAPFVWRHWLAARWGRYLRTAEGVWPVPGYPEPTLADDAAGGIGLYRANMRRHIRRPEPRQAMVPVQVIIVTRDRYVSAALAAQDLDQWAPRLSRQTIDATHWSVLTGKGTTVAEMIRQFAAGCGPGSLADSVADSLTDGAEGAA